MRLHRRQPTRLHGPWDSPGKNTGVGCHFLLQCMKVKSQTDVVQSCLTPSDPMDCSLPGSSVHGIFQARVLEWDVIAFSCTIWVPNKLIEGYLHWAVIVLQTELGGRVGLIYSLFIAVKTSWVKLKQTYSLLIGSWPARTMCLSDLLSCYYRDCTKV